MPLQKASLLLACACLLLPTLIAATEPAYIHEARQGPIQTSQPLSLGPGPVSLRPPSTSPTATMSSTPSSEPSLSSSSADSPVPSPNSPPRPSSSSGTLSSASSSGSSASPKPSSPSSLDFTVRNLTTCTSGLISWTYHGKEAPLLLSITNIGVPQDDASLRIGARQSTVNGAVQQQLADTNASAPSWTWPSVDVAQGWYKIQGLVLSTPTASSDSAPFFVANGTDVTCLIGTSPQASSTASPGDSISPSSAASKSNTGSIVGGIIGGVFGAALAIIAGICLWSRKRRRLFVGRSGRRDRNWGPLESVNSTFRSGGSGAHLNSDHFHVDSESTGAILQDAGVGKVSVTTTPGGSDEDVLVVSEEKLVSPASSSGMSPFDALNTPAYYDRRTSTYSIRTPTTASESYRSRVSSTLTSGQSLEQQAQRIRSSMETSTRRRSERLSMPTLPSPALARFPHSPTHTQPREEYPLTPVTPTPVNRSISTGAVSMTARRTSRKPVPQYDSSILLEDKNTDSASTFTAGAESSQSHGTGQGTGTNGTPSDMTRKASFWDGRPVHYLIPDMPPPQQD